MKAVIGCTITFKLLQTGTGIYTSTQACQDEQLVKLEIVRLFPSSPLVSPSPIMLTCQTVGVHDKRVAWWAGDEREVLDDKTAILICVF